MTITIRAHYTKRRQIPTIGQTQVFEVKGRKKRLTLNIVHVERTHDAFPAKGDDCAWYAVELVYGSHVNE